MKKYLIVSLIILSLLALSTTGCLSDEVEPDDETAVHQGLIYLIEDNRILVVNDIDSANIPWNSWFEKGKRAIMFTITADTVIELNGDIISADKLARGQEVEVWHSGPLAESYPEQGSADKIIITQDTSAGELYIDSGRFSGQAEDGAETLISIRISGVPEDVTPRIFRLTREAEDLMKQLNLQEGSEILFRYLEDENSDGLIFDLSLLGS